MRTAARLRGWAASWVVAVGLMAVTAAPGSALASGWGRAFTLTKPQTLDLSPPRLAVAVDGEIAVGYSRYDEDSPAGSRAYVVVRSPQGAASAPRALGGAQEVLDLAYSRSTLDLLIGGSGSNQACCSDARVVSLSGGRLGRAHTVAGGLAGYTVARLLALGSGRLLAAVATERGVWAAQSGGDGRFGPTHRLGSVQLAPWALAATILPSAATFIGFTQADPQPGGAAPQGLMLARGSASSAPRSARAALAVPAGHGLDELTLAPGAGEALGAWVESWFDADGTYRAQAAVADLGAHPRPRAFALPGLVASGIAAAGDGSGEDVVAWRACDRSGSCSVWAVFRRAGGGFSGPARLGVVDTGQAPAAAIGAGGRAMVGWVHGGRVLGATRGPRDRRFSAPRSVATSSYAHDLTTAIAADGSIVAVWTQGTLRPSLVGAFYRP